MSEANIINVKLEDKMNEPFLTYATYVILERAIANAMDGLKPVQRRILYAMLIAGIVSNSKEKKSARVVGDVLGKFHPHGDQSVYEAMVNMAQPWKKRYPLVSLHGNVGSIDGDGAAHMRYTEVRLSKIGESMMNDIRKDTVKFVPNYDDSEVEPQMLPSLFFNALCNGGIGTAVGIASSMAPHYAKDVYAAIDYVITCFLSGQQPVEEKIISIIKAPDFPTGGTIINPREIAQMYHTGKGRAMIRSKYVIEESDKKQLIVFTEIPYNTNKKTLVENIGRIVYNEKTPLDGVSEVRDESSKGGIRIVIELKKSASVERVLNNLFKRTDLQSSFAINNVMIINGRPVEGISLMKMILTFLTHACGVVQKKSIYILNKCISRLHIIEGLLKIDPIIDDVIAVIREAEDVIPELMTAFGLTEAQAKAVKARQLGSLNKIDVGSLVAEQATIREEHAYHENVVKDQRCLIIETQKQLKDFMESDKSPMPKDDVRKTDIDGAASDSVDDRELVKEEDIVISYSHNGVIKSVRVDEYNTQNRNGKGVGLKTRQDDFIENILTLSTKDNLLFITNIGRCHVLPAYKIPIVSKIAMGKYVNNFIELDENETICSVLSTKAEETEMDLMFFTRKGLAKRLSLTELSTRLKVTRVLTFRDDDSLVSCILVKQNTQVLAVTKKGMAIRTSIDNIRSMGRTAAGVTLMRLADNDIIVSAINVQSEEDTIFVVSDKGMGKRFAIKTVRMINRGGKGVIVYKPTEKTGDVVAAVNVKDEHSIFIVTAGGMITRIPASSITEVKSRASRGVAAIKLNDDDYIVSVSPAPEQIKEEEDVISQEDVEDVA